MVSGGCSLGVAHGLLVAVACLVSEHRLWSAGSGSSCGTQAWLPHGMCDPLGPGIEPMSPALAGGFLTTEPPGEASSQF